MGHQPTVGVFLLLCCFSTDRCCLESLLLLQLFSFHAYLSPAFFCPLFSILYLTRFFTHKVVAFMADDNTWPETCLLEVSTATCNLQYGNCRLVVQWCGCSDGLGGRTAKFVAPSMCASIFFANGSSAKRSDRKSVV